MSATATELLADLSRPGQPMRLFAAIEAETRRRVGHRLFTLLYVDGAEVARIHSNRPDDYPVSGRKLMGPTPWGDLVLRDQKPFVGRDMDAIRWAFFDHEQIRGLGLGAVINIPVVYDGATIGTMNMLDVEMAYGEDDAAKVADLAPLLIPAFLSAGLLPRSS